LVEELAKIKNGDVVLRTQTADGGTSKRVRVCCVTTPDNAQKVLLNRLGLKLPQRLRYLEEVEQMQSRLSSLIGPGAPRRADLCPQLGNLG
jgi:hypothetical protein